MKRARRKTILLSAALAGLTVCVVAPAAHGHGNNPGDRTRPDSPYPRIPDQKSPPSFAGSGFEPPEGITGGIGRRGGNLSSLSINNRTQGLSNVKTLPSLPLAPDPDFDMTPRLLMEATAPMAPVLRAGNINAALEGVFDDTLDRPQTPVVSRAAPRMIPAPGTLALLGLAALALRARRRRTILSAP